MSQQKGTRDWCTHGLPCVLALVAVCLTQQVTAQDEVIMRGASIGEVPLVSLSEALNDIDQFLDQSVIVEGKVRQVCQMKGCWMQLVPKSATTGVRVTFKDYGFFVPKESEGLIARLEGTFKRIAFSKKQADHFSEEGVQLKRNPDGTATEVSFVAVGVELHRETTTFD